MITLRTSIKALPANQKEVLLTLLALLRHPKMEQGCLSYAAFSDIKDSNAFNLISEWDTMQYLDQHLKSHRFSVLLGTKSLLAEPVKNFILASIDLKGIESIHDPSIKFLSTDIPIKTGFPM